MLRELLASYFRNNSNLFLLVDSLYSMEIQMPMFKSLNFQCPMFYKLNNIYRNLPYSKYCEKCYPCEGYSLLRN